jgi:hypothetical protein
MGGQGSWAVNELNNSSVSDILKLVRLCWFDRSKRIPGIGKGIEREPFKSFTMYSRNNEVVVIS